ncbi:MAG TPA: HD domain-containing protein [Syntrophomonadaceae bacterium]|nr:HD domain-containing protein [Syntrophomonadaceae bacterium]
MYKRPIIHKQFDKKDFNRLRQLVRLAALLHDVGHAPFSHGSEELFPNDLKHEDYSIAIIRSCFSSIIEKYFPDIKVDELTTLLREGYLSAELVFLGKIIDGELDADKLDYLLRDSYYCGVRYGKYDLERILDTITVVPTDGTLSGPAGFWLLGIDSDGIQAVEELIFARYWMFIQVYFHKTRRIYDHYLVSFLKNFLEEEYGGHYPSPDNLDLYLAFDDCTIFEALIKRKDTNIWAQQIYERKHLSEAFVTLPHQTGLDSYLIIKDLIQLFVVKFGQDPIGIYVDDKARKLPTNPFFGMNQQEESEDDEDAKGFASIVVQDKHNPENNRSIFELSLPLQLLSKRKINIVRFYVKRDMKEEAAVWCNEQYACLKQKVKQITERWT